MKELIERFRTTAYLVMCLLFTILIYLYTDGFITGKSDYFLIGCITVFVIVMVDYLTRRYVKNALLFFGIHLAMIAGVFVLPVTIAEKIINYEYKKLSELNDTDNIINISVYY